MDTASLVFSDRVTSECSAADGTITWPVAAEIDRKIDRLSILGSQLYSKLRYPRSLGSYIYAH